MTQTWVPTLDFTETARALDWRRLGAQRGEGLIVVRALTDRYASGAWANHPAVRMWRGHLGALCIMGVEVCREWRRRGHSDGCLPQYLYWLERSDGVELPKWWGDHPIHQSHRRALVARLPEHYHPIWPDEPAVDELEWPVPLFQEGT